MSASESFVARWSRKKAQERRRATQAEIAPPTDAAAPRDAAPDGRATPVAAPAELESLPPLDSLTKDSDFAPFLRPGVPDELKHAALRRLWTSDPVWAKPEVLDIHNLDYTVPSIPDLVQTAYRVGRGFLDGAEQSAEEKSPGATCPDGGPAAPPNDVAATPNDDSSIDQPAVVGCNKNS
jgi:hypothetical protein